MQLNCPKCAGVMRAYERNGVTIDQCTECRGIFLDRGELEHLIDGEQSYYQAPQRRQQPTSGQKAQPAKKNKMSFLSELLEF